MVATVTWLHTTKCLLNGAVTCYSKCYLRSTLGAGDRTQLRNRTTAQTQTLWPICGTSVHPKFRWRQISRRMTFARWQFINIARTLLQTTDSKFKKTKDDFLNFFLGDTFARWRTVSETLTIWRPILARQFLTTLCSGRQTLSLDDLLAKLLGGQYLLLLGRH